MVRVGAAAFLEGKEELREKRMCGPLYVFGLVSKTREWSGVTFTAT